jgi:hypothetical protein
MPPLTRTTNVYGYRKDVVSQAPHSKSSIFLAVQQKLQKETSPLRGVERRILTETKRVGRGESILLSHTPIRKVAAAVNPDSVIWN